MHVLGGKHSTTYFKGRDFPYKIGKSSKMTKIIEFLTESLNGSKREFGHFPIHWYELNQILSTFVLGAIFALPYSNSVRPCTNRANEYVRPGTQI